MATEQLERSSTLATNKQKLERSQTPFQTLSYSCLLDLEVKACTQQLFKSLEKDLSLKFVFMFFWAWLFFSSNYSILKVFKKSWIHANIENLQRVFKNLSSLSPIVWLWFYKIFRCDRDFGKDSTQMCTKAMHKQNLCIKGYCPYPTFTLKYQLPTK